MSLNYTITHNGSTWESTTALDTISLSNGSVTDSITDVGTRTLHTQGLYTPNNLVIGDKTLNCAGKIMSGDVTITASSAWSPPTTVGQEYTFDNKTWIAVHHDTTNDYWYLTLKDVYSLTAFSSGSTAYSGSTLASVATSFQSSMSSDALSHCVDIITEGVTAKVFVATYTQMNGGFSYFNSDANRIAYYTNGIAWLYWTSTAYSKYVQLVSTDGTLTIGSPTLSIGFRPSVCITG